MTPIVNDLSLNLPTASNNPKDPPRKANFVTLDAKEAIHLNKAPVEIGELQAQLVQLRVEEPDLSVIVRSDSMTKYEQIVRVMDALQEANVVKVVLAAEVADAPAP